MIEFNCTSCGKRLQAEESFAGKHVVCPVCNIATMAIDPVAPLDGAFREGDPPLLVRQPPRAQEVPSIAMRMMPTAIVVVVLGLIVALAIPAVQKTREAAARTQTINNLKQIGLASHGFCDANKRLPFNGDVPLNAPPFSVTSRTGSWMSQILPYIDSHPPKPMEGSRVYMCPGRGRPLVSDTGMWSDYCINPWINDPKNGSVNAPDGKRTLVGITDGTANTILIGHGSIDPTMYSATAVFAQSTDVFKGGDPATARRLTTNQRDTPNDLTLSWGGPFPQGAAMCMADATVRFFPYDRFSGGVIVNGTSTRPDPRPFVEAPLMPKDFRMGLGIFLTPSGGEPVTVPE